MRRIVLAALLAAVAMPAWARSVDEMANAITLCIRMGGQWSICNMKHVPDENAAVFAKIVIERCDKLEKDWNTVELWLQRTVGNRSDEFQRCTAERAYIKQRWGY